MEPITHHETYSTRFAANRAGKRLWGADYEVLGPGADKRYSVRQCIRDERGLPVASRKTPAKAAKPAPANATRAAEIARVQDAAKTAKAKKTEPSAPKAIGKRAQLVADAEAGILPPVPDFSANTHARFRPKLAELVALVAAKDIHGLKVFHINPISTSPKAMDRYRNLAVIALTAQAKAEARAA